MNIFTISDDMDVDFIVDRIQNLVREYIVPSCRILNDKINSLENELFYANQKILIYADRNAILDSSLKLLMNLDLNNTK